jgi:hypothetical protein
MTKMMKPALALMTLMSMGYGVSEASANVALTGEESRTQFSGKYDKSVTIIGSDTDSQGMFEIEAAESGDYPCHFKIRRRDFDSLSNSQYANGGDDNRSCDWTSKSKEVLSFSDTDTYIRGVQVCLNGNETRVKGIRVFGARLNRATGALANVSGNKEFVRPNCKQNDWKAAVYCPVGQVATKLRISSTGRYGSMVETEGLGLLCRAITVQ